MFEAVIACGAQNHCVHYAALANFIGASNGTILKCSSWPAPLALATMKFQTFKFMATGLCGSARPCLIFIFFQTAGITNRLLIREKLAVLFVSELTASLLS